MSSGRRGRSAGCSRRAGGHLLLSGPTLSHRQRSTERGEGTARTWPEARGRQADLRSECTPQPTLFSVTEVQSWNAFSPSVSVVSADASITHATCPHTLSITSCDATEKQSFPTSTRSREDSSTHEENSTHDSIQHQRRRLERPPRLSLHSHSQNRQRRTLYVSHADA